ncbi:MAG: hypothetical protein JRI50_11885, partial [Deltaproteobacteria bacterium]|nr:hypothetical protein [Deltaproteobacteria bacterium]
FEVTEADLRQTPPRVIRLLVYLLTRIQILEEAKAYALTYSPAMDFP